MKNLVKLVSAALALATAIILWSVNGGSPQYIPSRLLNGCPALPISALERAEGVTAKFGIDKAPCNDLLRWYENRGFNVVADKTQTNGYGPHGFSFSIFPTNQMMTLVVMQWKDL